jgi:hypothetical protein
VNDKERLSVLVQRISVYKKALMSVDQEAWSLAEARRVAREALAAGRRIKATEEIIMLPREMLRAAGRKRWEGAEKQELSDFGRAGGRASWASLTAEERSTEMKRRAKKRKDRASGGKP